MDNDLEDLDFILSFHPISSIKKMIFHGYSAIEQGWNLIKEMQLSMNYVVWMKYNYT
jgi:hypothetical protein